MRILKYNLNLAFKTLKYIMAYGVSTLQVAPRGPSSKAAQVFSDHDPKPQGNVPECPPTTDEASVSQSECDFYSTEIEVPTSLAPEPEFEVEVESTDNTFHRVTSPKPKSHGCFSQTSPHKISTINRRSRLWVKQMRRRRRRMSFFGGVQRSRFRYPSHKRWNNSLAPVSTRVDVRILKLLQNKRKQLKRDGLYQFVLWREALKAERNRLLGTKGVNI